MSVSPESDMQTNRNTSWQGTCIECSYVCSCRCIVISHESHMLLGNGLSCNKVLFCSVVGCMITTCIYFALCLANTAIYLDLDDRSSRVGLSTNRMVSGQNQ